MCFPFTILPPLPALVGCIKTRSPPSLRCQTMCHVPRCPSTGFDGSPLTGHEPLTLWAERSVSGHINSSENDYRLATSTGTREGMRKKRTRRCSATSRASGPGQYSTLPGRTDRAGIPANGNEKKKVTILYRTSLMYVSRCRRVGSS